MRREVIEVHIHEVTAVAGRQGPSRKRIGRGIGSHGKTSGRGHKGEGSRSGAKGYLVKEGGQMPMFRKVAKRGFSAGDYSVQKRIAIVNIGAIAKLDAALSTVNMDALIRAGLIPRRSQLVRVLGGGELNRALTIEADHVSRSAAQKIEGAGGKVVLL
ncbi:MAG: 50S ribosomal protein L15 [Planctomycetaceae bacterium]